MPLTNTKIQSAKAKDKPYKLSDERGLYLEVAPSGGKWWRFKYRFRGKEKRISLGTYPDTSLARARERREEARKQVAEGLDPSLLKRIKQRQNADLEANSFQTIACEWHANRSSTWSESHAKNINDRLKRDVFPWLGKRAIGEIVHFP